MKPSNSLVSKRKVHFVVCKFAYFEPPPNWDSLDFSQLYYSPEEYETISSNNNTTLRVMEGLEDPCSQNELCYRGLENRTNHGRQRRTRNSRNAVQAVLNEQGRQRKNGKYDADKVASIYTYYSAHCTKTAVSNALEDASLAEEHLQEPTAAIPSCKKGPTLEMPERVYDHQRPLRILVDGFCTPKDVGHKDGLLNSLH